MLRPKNKEELKIAADTNYKKLLTLIDGRSEAETGTDYDFSADEKKKLKFPVVPGIDCCPFNRAKSKG